MKTPVAIALLLDSLDEAFEKKSWHGTNLRGSLRGLSPREAAWRPGPGRHNVWEIALHAAYWKYAVRRRLTGEKRGSFPLAGSNWFTRPVAVTEAAWRADQAMLLSEHHQLREVVARLRPAVLGRKERGTRFSNAALIRGVAAHDLYHAQIQLLKRLRSAK